MDNQQKTVLTWALIVGVSSIAIYKFKDSLFGPSFNPTDLNVIAKVWNENPSNHQKYTYTIHYLDAQDIAQLIYKEFGVFKTNFTNVFALFQQCKTQGDIFLVVDAFFANYNVNLWSSLVNGFGLYPGSGLSSSELKNLNTYVLSLPL